MRNIFRVTYGVLTAVCWLFDARLSRHRLSTRWGLLITMETLLSRLPVPSPWIVLLGSFILVVVVAAGSLVGRIVHPTVIEFPWKEKGASSLLLATAMHSSSAQSSSGTRNRGSSDEEKDKTKTVVLAGSFNPVHKGHVSMLEYLATRYGRVVVVVVALRATVGSAGCRKPRLCSRFSFQSIQHCISRSTPLVSVF
jgi:Cytidylyltransferase-like